MTHGDHSIPLNITMSDNHMEVSAVGDEKGLKEFIL